MPSWLLYTLGVLIFAFGLLLSIALHEIGHMVPAKKFGVKVTQYMVGFGPTIWSRTRGDTEYGIKGVPLGGYIRMIGMVPPRADGTRSRWPRRMATAIEDFRQVSRAEVDEQDAHRQFYRLTPGKKMIVMTGGPVMNLLIYLVLTLFLLLALGSPTTKTTTTVGSISKCLVAANSDAAKANTCPAGAPATPAATSLKVGDKLLSVNGRTITSWDALTPIIQRSAGVPLSLVVDRKGTRVPLTITPVENTFYPNGIDKPAVTAGFLGLSPFEKAYFESVGITGVPGKIGSQLKLGVDALANYPSKLHSLWQTVFEGKQRDPEGAVGVVGIGRISGDLASDPGFTLKSKIYTLIGLLASVNLLLFLFNLLPLLPLDGGHVAGALVEAVKRGRARLRARGRPAPLGPDGRPLPRPAIFVDTAQMLPVMYAVASVLVVLTLLTLYADIVKPINLNGG
ncbi:RIP metalloprotease [uncultured Jatrophihabitans sp.]|uniref:M50 family metallopeptidase n=1 Tax=uncultured Jatrophihabitans sp. TaxID=1610747 RepID=UPI0035CA61C4